VNAADFAVLPNENSGRESSQCFCEGSELLMDKAEAVLSVGLKVIFCCGKALEVREAGTYIAIMSEQSKSALFHLPPEAWLSMPKSFFQAWA